MTTDRRKFKFLTVNDLMEQLETEGVGISRGTLYALERRGLFESKKAVGGWRVYTQSDIDIIVRLIKENYGLIEKEDVEALAQHQTR